MAEINYMKEFYPIKPTNYIAEKLGRTYEQIKQRAYALGIKKLEKV